MTKNIFNISCSIFLITCTIFVCWSFFAIESALDQHLSLLEQKKKYQLYMKENGMKINKLLSETSIALTAVFLSERNIIRTVDSDKIILESLDNINSINPRIGEVTKYINDYRINQQRNNYFVKKASEFEKTTDPGVRRLSFENVNGNFVRSNTLGQVFVIKGNIINNYPDSRSFILLKGSILDGNGNLVRKKLAYAGNTYGDNILRDMSLKDIQRSLKNQDGNQNQNVNIPPSSSIPFMIVFDNLPDNLSEFEVQAISSAPGK